MDSQTSILEAFHLTKVLDQDPKQKSANLLGTLKDAKTGVEEPAILLLEKTHFSEDLLNSFADQYSATGSIAAQDTDGQATKLIKLDGLESNGSARRKLFERVQNLGQNDIYTWLLVWLNKDEAASGSTHTRDADIKANLIYPATQTHIEKYSAQRKVMVRETPQIYAERILPWIESIPASRIQWVYNILEHKKETESVLFEDPDPKTGFIILPDLKWDQKTTSSLYIQAIVHDRSLRSMRDLTKDHVDMLRNIREQASRVAFERFGLTSRSPDQRQGNVRCFIHYHPSFYHLHVHILATSFTWHPGAIVGQAHLLDDVIDLLELGVDFKQRTLSYALGTNNKLWDVLEPSVENSAAQP
ncbi:scavenger mRNA decapping enzyme [Testicularia cyperi]|uniref:m7GpppX diphosphatase n=1 Tax=Testicularia cyperi TaxID=1882483 RepID=A0A317XQ52_9BASI|nr:scavenger mRNA decapping enzyme [Testicularia cyperi]